MQTQIKKKIFNAQAKKINYNIKTKLNKTKSQQIILNKKQTMSISIHKASSFSSLDEVYDSKSYDMFEKQINGYLDSLNIQ